MGVVLGVSEMLNYWEALNREDVPAEESLAQRFGASLVVFFLSVWEKISNLSFYNLINEKIPLLTTGVENWF